MDDALPSPGARTEAEMQERAVKTRQPWWGAGLSGLVIETIGLTVFCKSAVDSISHLKLSLCLSLSF